MNTYIQNFQSFSKKLVYDFKLGDGGIGDNIKFFMYMLESCMKTNTQLYYKKNNIEIEKYIKLKYEIMYINDTELNELQYINVIRPYALYSSVNYNYSIPVSDVFYFSDEVKINKSRIFPPMTNYVSVHLRLGDKYLETDKNYVLCKEDVREFSQQKIHKFIEDNVNENIFFCCDNKKYKLDLKAKYNNIIITDCDIGHTSLSNTSSESILNAVTEFYILTNSSCIFAGSSSVFSIIASKFNNIPLLT